MSQEGLKRDFEIQNKLGIHLRPASLLVKTAGDFQSKIYLSKDGMRVPGNSILSVIALVAGKGSKITVEAIGEDAQEALDALEDLIVRRKFDED